MRRFLSLNALLPLSFLSLKAIFSLSSGSSLSRKKAVRLNLMALEERAVPAVLLPLRTIDGSGNNLAHAEWGQAGTDYLRIAPAAYADGISSAAGASLPSGREISNALSDQNGQSTTNDRLMSAMVYAWGQFIDHDMGLANTGTSEPLPIAVPMGDPSFDPASTGTQTISMKRSVFDEKTGTSTANPRQQVNAITAWMDGSMIYGSDATTAASLRTMQGGQMKTSVGNLLPTDEKGNFLAGDTRAQENPELTSLQTVFVREHNRLAAEFAKANPTWTDEQLYQQARSWVIGEVQAITYNEWLPSLLGQAGLKTYSGYKPQVNPGIANEFATAGFRFGHSIVGSDIEFLDNNGVEVAPAMSLKDAFFNPTIVKTLGVDGVLKYLASDPSQEVDLKVVDELRDFLFGAPGQGGLDLVALNIQRGRDHGLSGYNATRAAYGLAKVTDFAQITDDKALQAQLKAVYGSVDKVELWIGVLAEKHLPGASVGATARAIIADQFTRLRDGDRLWYQNTFKGADLQTIQRTSLSAVIARNTGLDNLQKNAFFFKAEVNGKVFVDTNGDGKLSPRETVLGKVKVELVAIDSGEVFATTTTNQQGQYSLGVLDGLRLGSYTVRVTLPDGNVVDGPKVTFTKGDTMVQAHVAVPPKPPAARAATTVTAQAKPSPVEGIVVDGSMAFRQIVGAMLAGQVAGAPRR